MAFLIGTTAPALQRLAVPVVCLLVAFLGYVSQWLFAHAPDLAPGPLSSTETYVFNTLLLCLWYTYYKACTVDPGRYEFPGRARKKRDDDNDDIVAGTTTGGGGEGRDNSNNNRRRYCKKCAAPKPPRAHHCKTCRRCIPKMDHHCPWTSNCVSLQTFPHFVRFLLYANASLWALLYHVSRRFQGLWRARHLPAYLGPTPAQLVLLTVLGFAGCITALALGVLLAATLKGWLFNMTMIEGWEVERHEAVLERGGGTTTAGGGGGADAWWGERDDDDNAPRSVPDPVEFPYDIGFFANMAQAMGTRNPVWWIVPFAGGPRVNNINNDNGDGTMRGPGWEYEENGLNDTEGAWPPVDPDKVRQAKVWRRRRREMDGEAEAARERDMRWTTSPEEERDAFRRRQERDLRRWEGGTGTTTTTRSRILGELEEVEDYDDYDFVDEAYGNGYGTRPGGVIVEEGKSGWVNADGEQLGDFGVDEDAEFDDEHGAPESLPEQLGDEGEDQGDDDEVPLAELIRRRRVLTKDGEDT